MVGVLGILVSASTFARDDPSHTAVHPLVGSWRVSISGVSEPEEALYTFFSDGNIMATSSTGARWHGHWEVTGQRTGRFILVALGPGTPGNQGITRISDVEVDESGDRLGRPSAITGKSGIQIEGARILIDR